MPPGDYVLDVQQRPRDIQNLQSRGLVELEFASVPLSVAGDIDGLVSRHDTRSHVSGRVVFQGQNAQKATPRGIQVSATRSVG